MRILITGATGMIGSEIVRQFHKKEVRINYLTTAKDKIQKQENYSGFYWNPAKGEIDFQCIEGVGAIIHLAGSSIFKPWTIKNKKEIIRSRVEGADLLYKTLEENEHEVGQFVSASGISIYPSSYRKLYFEDEKQVADTFLGKLTREWEAAADRFTSLGLRVAKIRTGIVLAEDGGALAQMQRPVKLGVGSPLGNGKQWQSWIHLEDLARIYIYTVENGLVGVYNATAPDPVTNRELMQEIAKIEGKKMWLPNVPAFGMKLVMGEMANVALESQLVASRKIQKAGFSFNFVNLGNSLRDLKLREEK